LNPSSKVRVRDNSQGSSARKTGEKRIAKSLGGQRKFLPQEWKPEHSEVRVPRKGRTWLYRVENGGRRTSHERKKSVINSFTAREKKISWFLLEGRREGVRNWSGER